MKGNNWWNSCITVDGKLYVAVGSDGEGCRIVELGDDGAKNVAPLSGAPCNILLSFRDNLLVSAGNILYTVSNNGAKPVLKANNRNWFWHAVEAYGRVFVQEYGESLTGIYVSEDLVGFRLLATNKDVDPLSRHFHYISFDERRNILIAMLGDGNIVKVAISTNCRSNWTPLYKGPWQLVPVLVEEDRWVLGLIVLLLEVV